MKGNFINIVNKFLTNQFISQQKRRL